MLFSLIIHERLLLVPTVGIPFTSLLLQLHSSSQPPNNRVDPETSGFYSLLISEVALESILKY